MLNKNRYDRVDLTPDDMRLLSKIEGLGMLPENEEFRVYYNLPTICLEIAEQKKQNFFKRGGLYEIHRKEPEWANPTNGFLCYLARVVKSECGVIDPHEVTVVKQTAEEHIFEGDREFTGYGDHFLKLPNGTTITDMTHVVTVSGDITLMAPTRHYLKISSEMGVEVVEYAAEYMDTIALMIGQQAKRFRKGI